MSIKNGIMNKKRYHSSLIWKGETRVFKINKIRIDGFRNISNTVINFNDSITAFLAPNNFGKTNLLHGIELASYLIAQAGHSWQARTIRGNNYTSHNIPQTSERYKPSFLFEIEFEHDGENITYMFNISPQFGVLEEKLNVDGKIIFDRAKGDDSTDGSGELNLSMGDYTFTINKYNLVVSYMAGRPINDAFYMSVVWNLFDSMGDMFCNRESPYGDYYNEVVCDMGDIIISILRLYKENKSLYYTFKNAFLSLFKDEIKDFAIYNIRDWGRVIIPTVFNSEHSLDIDFSPDVFDSDEYRLEFIVSNRVKPESFKSFSTGTQDIFLTLLQTCSKGDNSIIALEELENGIHPSLYKRVLETIDVVCGNKRALVTTHSPAIARHFSNHMFGSFYVGIPSSDGLATFYSLDESKRTEIEEMARFNGISVGEMIIDMLTESKESLSVVKGWLNATR